MKKYLISFYWEEDVNSKVAIAIKSKIEQLSSRSWIQIFPNLLLIKSEQSINDIYSGIEAVSSDKRFIITEISDIATNEERSNNLLEKHEY